MKKIKTFDEFINEGFQGDNDDVPDDLNGFRGGSTKYKNSSFSIGNKYYNKFSKIPLYQIFDAIESTMSLHEFNKLMDKVRRKLNIK